MNELSADVLKVLGNLPKEELERIKATLKGDGAIFPSPKKTQIFIEEISHEYHCEFCLDVRVKSYPVKITTNDKERSVRKPVILYTVCDECKKTLVVGLAFALIMRKAASRES